MRNHPAERKSARENGTGARYASRPDGKAVRPDRLFGMSGRYGYIARYVCKSVGREADFQ
eukprot:2765293-Pleurochrysis_carterae.AAC.1